MYVCMYVCMDELWLFQTGAKILCSKSFCSSVCYKRPSQLSTDASFLMLEKQLLVRQLKRSTVSFKKTEKCAVKYKSIRGFACA